MSIAITEDHLALAATASELLAARDARGAARALLEAPAEELPAFWAELVSVGWPGLHLPEDVGGSGFGIEELVVVVEQLGRSIAPGPFVPSAIASAVIAAAGDDAARAELLPGFADGTRAAGVALDADLTTSGGRWRGRRSSWEAGSPT